MSRAVANSSCTQGGVRGGGRFGCNHRACVWQRGAARPAGNAKTSAVLAGSYDRLRAQSSAEHVQHARGKGTHRRQLRGAEPGKKAAQKNEGSAGHGCHNCFLERGLRWVTLAWNPRASARYLKSPTLSVWVERMRGRGLSGPQEAKMSCTNPKPQPSPDEVLPPYDDCMNAHLSYQLDARNS